MSASIDGVLVLVKDIIIEPVYEINCEVKSVKCTAEEARFG